MRSRGILTVGLAILALCSVGVASANDAPLAEAGLDQEAAANTTVYLNAGGSLDPDGAIDRYRWSIAAPDGSELTPDCETCVTTWFVPSQVGQYNLTIQVVDDSGTASEDTLYVTVEGRSSPVSGTPSGGIGDSGGPAGGSGGGPVLSGGTGGCPGCGGSTGSNEAILVNDGGETMVSAGTIEPWETVEVPVMGGENVQIDGDQFLSHQTGPGEAPVSAFGADLEEVGATLEDVDGSLRSNRIAPGRRTADRIESRSYDQQMQSIRQNMENSPLSSLRSTNTGSDTDNSDNHNSDDSSSDGWNPSSETPQDDYDPGFSSDSSTGNDDGSESSSFDESSTDSSTLSDMIGPIGPHP